MKRRRSGGPLTADQLVAAVERWPVEAREHAEAEITERGYDLIDYIRARRWIRRGRKRTEHWDRMP